MDVTLYQWPKNGPALLDQENQCSFIDLRQFGKIQLLLSRKLKKCLANLPNIFIRLEYEVSSKKNTRNNLFKSLINYRLLIVRRTSNVGKWKNWNEHGINLNLWHWRHICQCVLPLVVDETLNVQSDMKALM